MAHEGLFATYVENIHDASGHIAVRENKVADGVLRHLVHGLHQGGRHYQSVTHTFRAHVRVTATEFTIPRKLTAFFHQSALNSRCQTASRAGRCLVLITSKSQKKKSWKYGKKLYSDNIY